MWNKICIFVCLFCICGASSAQTARRGNKQADRKTVAKTETKALRFDARKTTLTAARVEQALNTLRKELLTRELPDSLDKVKKLSDTLSNLSYRSIAESYHAVSGHFEASEVTGITPAWYRSLDQRVDAFKNIVHSLNFAVQIRNQTRYTEALEAFRKHQAACLEFLKKQPPKLSSEQLIKLRNVNTRKRRTEHQAKLRKEREARLKKQSAEKSTEQGDKK